MKFLFLKIKNKDIGYPLWVVLKGTALNYYHEALSTLLNLTGALAWWWVY